jgi:hypothetical protein
MMSKGGIMTRAARATTLVLTPCSTCTSLKRLPYIAIPQTLDRAMESEWTGLTPTRPINNYLTLIRKCKCAMQSPYFSQDPQKEPRINIIKRISKLGNHHLETQSSSRHRKYTDFARLSFLPSSQIQNLVQTGATQTRKTTCTQTSRN